MALLASNSLNLLDLVENEREKTYSESILEYCFLYPIYRGLKYMFENLNCPNLVRTKK